MHIAVILPSRGLVFSQTMSELLGELQGRSYSLFMAHSQPIPEAFETPTTEALDSPCDYLWFVEEDMILPPGILQELLDLDADVVSADYPVGSGEPAITYNDGVPLYGGTGCLLVKRSVFDRLQPPYFETDNEYDIEGKLIGKKSEAAKAVIYGQHDIGLWMKFHELGIIPKVTASTCGQRRLVEAGQPGVNTGYHTIREMWLTKPV